MTTKRFRYRLDQPRPAQAVALAQLFGCCRVVFNDVLRAREDAHQAGLPFPTSGDLSKRLITQAKLTPQRAWLNHASAVALQQALADADRAYRNFFTSLSGKRKGPRVGKPRYKTKRDRRQSARFTKNARFKLRQVNTRKATLTLPGIGNLTVRYSRPVPSDPSSVTVIQEADGALFASFVVDVPASTALPVVNRHAGVDMGLTDYAAVVASDGTRTKIANPRLLRTAERKLKKAQQNLSRKQKGSHNRAKARTVVARAHRKVRDARLDHAHKTASTLIRENQTISVEALNVRGLARSGAKGRRGRGIRKSVHDAGWSQFLRLLAEKADERGRIVTALNPAYSSQTCAVCGVLDGPKSLAIRQWQCQSCRTWLDRDYNAATNMLVAAGHAETKNACGQDVRLTLASASSADLDETGTTHTAAA